MADSPATVLLASITTPVNVVHGTSGEDYLNGTPGRDDIFGEAGEDTLNGFQENDRLFGGDGNDYLSAHQGDDHLFGEAGNDNLNAGEGNDRLSGGDGDDDLMGEEGDDRSSGGDGDDYLSAGTGNDWMSGDAGRDRLVGGPGGNTILGGTGKDLIPGAGGDDSISGGADADWLSGYSGHDTVAGGAGDDLLGGGDGNDHLLGDEGRDTIHGGLGLDDLRGGAGDDDLRGGWGQDSMKGEAGNDQLFGEQGNDWLSGGDGNDTIYGDGGPDYTLQARIEVPGGDPGYPSPREMILTDGETLVVMNGMSELLTYDVDTQNLVGQFSPLTQELLLDVSVSDGQVLIGSLQLYDTLETPLARLYDTASHVLRDFTSPDPTDTSFGAAVALEDDRAVVVSDKAAYVYDAGSGQLEHTIPLPPSVYGWQWPPLDVELSGDTIAVHAGAFEGEEVYVLDAGTGAFIRQIEVPPKSDSALNAYSYRAFELTGDKVVFSDPMTRESGPFSEAPASIEPVLVYDTDTGQQVRVLERDVPESLSPLYSRLVESIGADGSEVAVADHYVAGPDGFDIEPIISVLDVETGKPIQRLDDPGIDGQVLGLAFSGGILAIDQVHPEKSGSSLVSLFWRDRPQDGGDDIIWGGSGDDHLYGGSGRDWLSGDAGDDSLSGGGGADIFMIEKNSEQDRILDFQPDDRILFASAGTVSLGDLETTVTTTGTLITAGSNAVELVGISKNEVNQDWFTFA